MNKFSQKLQSQEIGLIIDGLGSKEKQKLDTVLLGLQQQGEITIVKLLPGEQYLFRKVRIAKSNSSSFKFHQLLRAECELEQLSVIISTDIGKIYVSAK